MCSTALSIFVAAPTPGEAVKPRIWGRGTVGFCSFFSLAFLSFCFR